MESLPALHPIILKSISSPPFEYSEEGITFRGHVRESIADLKCWLLPTRKNAQPLGKTKDWWMAQLLLHGIHVKDRMLKADVMRILKAAVRGGLNGPPEDILQLERNLERKFLLENAEARDKEYGTLNEGERAAKHSERYLREKFFNGTNDENVIVLRLHQERYATELHTAARKLGLHSKDASASRRRKLLIVGKDKANVRKEVLIWEQEFDEWNEKREAAKRRQQCEIRKIKQIWRQQREIRKANQTCRQQYEDVGVGSFKDVVGEWTIRCPAIYKYYEQRYRKHDYRSMSIYFDDPVSEEEDGSYKDEGESDSEESVGHSEGDSQEEAKTEDSNTESLPQMLCANFDFGVLTGVLRSESGGLPAPSSSFPTPWVPFSWRYRESFHEGAYIQYENETGYLKFMSEKRLEGVIQGWSFVGRKVDNVPANQTDMWEDYSREQYEFENARRWGRWYCRRQV